MQNKAELQTTTSSPLKIRFYATCDYTKKFVPIIEAWLKTLGLEVLPSIEVTDLIRPYSSFIPSEQKGLDISLLIMREIETSREPQFERFKRLTKYVRTEADKSLIITLSRLPEETTTERKALYEKSFPNTTVNYFDFQDWFYTKEKELNIVLDSIQNYLSQLRQAKSAFSLALSAVPPEEKWTQVYFKKILDTKLYRDPCTQHIYIGFDLISNNFDDAMQLPLKLHKHLQCSTRYWERDERALASILETAKDEEKLFLCSDFIQDTIVEHSSGRKFAKNSIYYQLPTNPNAALNWLGAFILYLNIDAGDSCIHFKDYTKEAYDNSFQKGLSEVTSIQAYQKENDINATIHKVLIEAILALRNDSQDIYAETLQAIGAIYKIYIQDRERNINLKFIQYLQDKIRLSIINKKSFIEQAKDSIHQSPSVANSFRAKLEGHNQLILNQIIAPTINQPAHDGNKYNLSYTEFQFLIPAYFAMTHDGKLSIVALEKNPGYIQFYAPGKRNEPIFEPELQFLAKKLDLSFDKDNFKNNGIVFSQESTRKLLDFGIICIEEKIKETKKELYAQNFWSFFGRSKVDKPDMGANILHLPRDAMQIIQCEMENQRSCL